MVHWLAKAIPQAVLAATPGGVAVNELLQRVVGGRRRSLVAKNVEGKLSEIRSMLDALRACGFDIGGKRVLELGTGWEPIAALCLAAEGARVTTMDLTRHVKTTEAVRESVRRAITGMCFPNEDTAPRHRALRRFVTGATDVEGLLDSFGVQYLAPVPDDMILSLPPRSFDLVFSIAVLEHVRPENLETIMRGQEHALAPTGLAYHDIGLGDHFYDVDPTTSFANFLRFDDGNLVWRVLGENRLAYHNRYRRSDFARRFAEHGWREAWSQAAVDQRSKELIASGELRPAGRFASLDMDDLATWRLAVVLERDRR